MRKLLKYYLSAPLLNRKTFKVEDSLILCSEARGGSTWLMEILNLLPGSIVNWEPLHHVHGPIPASYDWYRRPYIPEDQAAPQYKKTMKEVLTYQRFSPWSLIPNRLRDVMQAQFVLTKTVRAIPMLPWLIRQFEFRHAPILLLRHPIDTCLSMIKAFGLERDEQGNPCIPRRIREQYPNELDFLKQLKSPLEFKVAIWCLDNLPTLQNPLVQEKAVWVYYEDLVMKPEAEVKRILHETGLEEECPTVLENADFRKSSQTDFKQQLLKNPEEQLWKNINRLSDEEKVGIQRIFDRYHLKRYSAYCPFPAGRKLMKDLPGDTVKT